MNSFVCLLAFVGVAVAHPFLSASRASPLPAVVPVSTSSQYHAQDELGQYTYGYNDGNSVKAESKDAFGITRGSYSYVAPNGQLIQNNYVADGNGFRSSLAPTDGNAGPLVARVPAPVINVSPAHVPAPVVRISSGHVPAYVPASTYNHIPAQVALTRSGHGAFSPYNYGLPFSYGVGAGYGYNVPLW